MLWSSLASGAVVLLSSISPRARRTAPADGAPAPPTAGAEDVPAPAPAPAPVERSAAPIPSSGTASAVKSIMRSLRLGSSDMDAASSMAAPTSGRPFFPVAPDGAAAAAADPSATLELSSALRASFAARGPAALAEAAVLSSAESESPSGRAADPSASFRAPRCRFFPSATAVDSSVSAWSGSMVEPDAATAGGAAGAGAASGKGAGALASNAENRSSIVKEHVNRRTGQAPFFRLCVCC